jgi:hypothetical protein
LLFIPTPNIVAIRPLRPPDNTRGGPPPESEGSEAHRRRYRDDEREEVPIELGVGLRKCSRSDLFPRAA